MIETDKIYNMDCLEGMSRMPEGSVDAIIADLPYGVLNRGNRSACWDRQIPLGPLWEQYRRIIKPDSPIILFAQGIFSAHLMLSQPGSGAITSCGRRTVLRAISMPSGCRCASMRTFWCST